MRVSRLLHRPSFLRIPGFLEIGQGKQPEVHRVGELPQGRFRRAFTSTAAGAVLVGISFGFLTPAVAAADTGANQCHADPAVYTPAGASFPVDGDQYNVGYDANWFVFDQDANPQHSSDFTGSRQSDSRHTSGHHGVDIFGPEGAPLVAPEDAEVVAAGPAGKGGNRVWLHAPETDEYYYYAHLEYIEPGIEPGVQVPAGGQVGGLGDTGNAQGTAPHLHFELHPGDRSASAVDPFPRLMEWRENEQWREAVGELEARTVDAVCTIGEAWESEHPAVIDGDHRSWFFDAKALADLVEPLGLDQGAVERLEEALDVLGYANGIRNGNHADTVSIADLRAIADGFEEGKSFASIVEEARESRSTTELNRAVRLLAGAMERGDLTDADGEPIIFLDEAGLREAGAGLKLDPGAIDQIVAHLDVLGSANGYENPDPRTVSRFDLAAIRDGLADGHDLGSIPAPSRPLRSRMLPA